MIIGDMGYTICEPYMTENEKKAYVEYLGKKHEVMMKEREERMQREKEIKQMTFEELYELYVTATNEVATLKDENKALAREIEEISRQEEETSGIVYDPPMSQTDEYLLKKQREEEYKSYDY